MVSENIVIEFNEETEKRNQKFFFKYIWKKKFHELKRAVIYAIIFLTIGFLPLKGFDENLLPYIFRYLGFLYIGYIFLTVYQYIYSKKKNNLYIEEIVADFKKSENKSLKITLDSDSLKIENAFNIFGSVWEKTTYKFADDYLIVGILKNGLNFIFTKSEFKSSDFDNFLNYLHKYSKEEK